MDASILQPLFQIIILIMSVVIHEVAHGYVALWEGDPTAKHQDRLTLNPIKHIDPLGSIIIPGLLLLLQTPFVFGWAKPVPVNPYNFKDKRMGDLRVSLAGPLSNIALAIPFGLLIRFGADTLPSTAIDITTFIVVINLVLAIFNLIPVPPLDGSKVLFALLPRQYEWIREQLEQYGFILIFLVVILLAQLIPPVVAVLFKLITGVAAGIF